MLDYFQTNLIEAGCDEAGRGCLAGSVFAAAVILNPGFDIPGLNDSKKLSESKRNLLRKKIEAHTIWSVASVSAKKIDEINILKASFLAMHRAIKKLSQKPEFLLIDGNRFKPYKKLPHECIIKGDAKYKSIAAASILAKTHRDEYMKKLHGNFPHYGWNQNKAYPTKQHRDAIKKHGICKHHRKSFRLKENI